MLKVVGYGGIISPLTSLLGVYQSSAKKIVHMGRPMPNRRVAEFNNMMHCLQALDCIGYQVPNYSFFEIQALREHNPDVAQVSERIGRYNQMDVVKSCMISESCLFICYCYMNVL